MSHPRLRVAFCSGLLVLAGGATAFAQEIPGALTNAGGLTASDATPMLGARPLWFDGAGAVIARNELAAGSAPECWSVAGEPAERLGALVDDPPEPAAGDVWHVAAGSGADALALLFRRIAGSPGMTLRVYRGSCAGPSTLLGELRVPLMFAPAQEAWPLDEGVAYLIDNSGTVDRAAEIYRLDTRPTIPTWSAIPTPGIVPTTIGLTPGAALWIAYERADRATGFATLSDDGTATVLRAPDPNIGVYRVNDSAVTQILPFPEIDAVLIGSPTVRVPPAGAFRLIGVVPEATGPSWTTHLPPWPYSEGIDYDGFISGQDGGIWARHRRDFGYSLRRVGVDRAIADFDRDGLTALREAELGTSDALYDSDRDGANDGVEVDLFDTDPADAASRPDPGPAEPVRLAPSMLFADRDVPGGLGDPGWLSVPEGNASLLCIGGGEALDVCPAGMPSPLECYDGDAEQVCLFGPSDWGAVWGGANLGAGVPVFTHDGRYGFFFEVVPGERTDVARVERYDTSNGTTTTFIDDATWDALIADAAMDRNSPRRLHALSGDAVLIETFGFNGSGLIRWALSKGAEPIAGDAWRVVGFMPGLDAVVVGDPDRYLAVSAERAGFLADAREIADGLAIESLLLLPGGGAVAQAKMLDTSDPLRPARASWVGSFGLDGHFAELAVQQGYIGEYRQLGAWFHDGFPGPINLNYKIVRPGSPCGETEDPSCGTGPGGEPVWDVPFGSEAEWVPVPTALEPGEVVAASMRTYVTPPQNFGGPPVPIVAREATGDYRPWDEPEPRWRLWRVTRLGAVSEWLAAGDIAAHTGAGGQASLTAMPLGPISALRASPDATRLCMVEPAAGRVWELVVSAGELDRAELIDEAPGVVGCAYDATGQLALLMRSPAELRIGARTLPARGAPAEMIRADGGWVVRDASGPAYCLADAGDVRDLGVTMSALGELPGGGAIFVDAAGRGWAGSDPCGSDTFPEESLDEGGIAYAGPTCKSDASALAMRPDGLVLVSGCTTDVFPAKLLLGLEPRFVPRDPRSRISELDRYRRDGAKAILMSNRLIDVSAMVTLPGGDPDADWGHFGPPEEPVAPPPIPDEPAPETGTDTGPTAKRDDGGCSGGETGGAGLVALLALALRRRTLVFGALAAMGCNDEEEPAKVDCGNTVCGTLVVRDVIVVGSVEVPQERAADTCLRCFACDNGAMSMVANDDCWLELGSDGTVIAGTLCQRIFRSAGDEDVTETLVSDSGTWHRDAEGLALEVRWQRQTAAPSGANSVGYTTWSGVVAAGQPADMEAVAGRCGERDAFDAEGFAALVGCRTREIVDLGDPLAERVITFGGDVGTTYRPRCIRIAPGQAVTFRGPFADLALAPGIAGAFTAGSQPNPITYRPAGTEGSFTFPDEGDFLFHCSTHPELPMAGLVRVE